MLDDLAVAHRTGLVFDMNCENGFSRAGMFMDIWSEDPRDGGLEMEVVEAVVELFGDKAAMIPFVLSTNSKLVVTAEIGRP